MSLSKDGQDFIISLIVRVVELFEENEFLKRELKARRHQSDVWRKRAQEANLKLQFVQIYLGEEKTVDDAIEEVGYTPRRKG